MNPHQNRMFLRKLIVLLNNVRYHMSFRYQPDRTILYCALLIIMSRLIHRTKIILSFIGCSHVVPDVSIRSHHIFSETFTGIHHTSCYLRLSPSRQMFKFVALVRLEIDYSNNQWCMLGDCLKKTLQPQLTCS